MIKDCNFKNLKKNFCPVNYTQS